MPPFVKLTAVAAPLPLTNVYIDKIILIAPAFTDILYANCFKNGILPVCRARFATR